MKQMHDFMNDDDGTASIEFVFIIPIIMTIFMASFEASLFMNRYVMMERSVDIVVRNIRLGVYTVLDPDTNTYSSISHEELKLEICESGMMVNSVATCIKAMRIWMQPISTVDFQMLAPPKFCSDRREDITPLPEPGATEFGFGEGKDIMLMRICLKEEPMFPTTLIGAGMIKDELDGNYSLVTTTVFVNEPR